MRNAKYPLALILFAFFAFTSCKKDSSKPIAITLTGLDTGKAVILVQGQIVKITLGNFDESGYTFNTWQYDAGILHLDSHSSIPPANTGTVGNSGSDVWQFSALKSGTSTLKISATQGLAGETINMFSDTVKVR